MKWRELEAEQAKSLDYKIEQAKVVIGQAFDIAHLPALAFSAGKDSTVLRDIIRRFYPEQFTRMVEIWGNTGVEYPECVKFARKIAQEDAGRFYEARPGKTDKPCFKYDGQRRIWERLITSKLLPLKHDGKLASTLSLERMCPPDLRGELVRERLVWPAGTTMSYWWCTDQYGWPLLGKSWSKLDARRINIDTFLEFSSSVSANKELLAYYNVLRSVKISQHCCKVLKKDPSERVQAELGVDLIFKGLMASESRSRAKNFLTRGYLFEGAKRDYLRGEPFFHCQPIAIWTDDDVWAYIRRYDVPYASLYDMTFVALDGSTQHVRRNGCLGCATDFGFQNNHLYVLRQTHRPAWRAIMRAGMAEEIRNLQRAMRSMQLSIFDTLPTEELIDAQPCMFDDLDGMGGTENGNGLVYDPEAE